MSIIIKNGRVINPATGMDEIADVLILDDKVTEISKGLAKGKKADRVIDAKGKYVMPGFVDMHVHFRDPGYEEKEDIFTGMKAAARGGYTTVVCMPNTKPVADNTDVINYVHNKAKSAKCINVYQTGSITKGQKGKVLSDIEEMVKAGAPAISEDGKSVMDAYVYREAMKVAKELDIPVLAHCEDINLVHGGVVNEDDNSKKNGFPGITNSVEDIIIARDLMLAKETGVQIHLCHCSTSESVNLVRHGKKSDIRVSAEVCPHHFTLTSDDIKDFVPQIENGIMIPKDTDADTNYKMNPPLRTKKDVEALKNGLKEGVIEVIATDHAPHTFEEKNTSIKKAPFGIVGLETAASLTHNELVLEGWLTPMQMAEKMSYNPAKIMKFDCGNIEPGKMADIVIFDPKETYIIDKKDFASKGKNTPFDGFKVTGKVKCTICAGRVVYEDK